MVPLTMCSRCSGEYADRYTAVSRTCARTAAYIESVKHVSLQKDALDSVLARR